MIRSIISPSLLALVLLLVHGGGGGGVVNANPAAMIRDQEEDTAARVLVPDGADAGTDAGRGGGAVLIPADNTVDSAWFEEAPMSVSDAEFVMSDTALEALASGEVDVIYAAGNQIDLNALAMGRNSFETFDMKGKVHKSVRLNDFVYKCPRALIDARTPSRNANNNNVNSISCVNTKVTSSGCGVYNYRYWCYETEVLVSGPDAVRLSREYKNGVEIGRFGSVLYYGYSILSQDWRIISEPSSPTEGPTSSTTTDAPTTLRTCDELEDDCLSRNQKEECKEYLRRSVCSVCNGKNRDNKKVCYPKTGRIYKKAGGYCGLCPKSNTNGCISTPPISVCKDRYKRCWRGNQASQCRGYLAVNKCAYKGNKKAGQAYKKGRGYCGICQERC